MDAHRYDEWHALWDEDATYWVPANDDDIDPARNVSVIYDRRGQLRNRIQRLRETLWLKESAPRLKRLVSNVEAETGRRRPYRRAARILSSPSCITIASFYGPAARSISWFRMTAVSRYASRKSSAQ